MDSNALIAAFLAKGGKVTHCNTGEQALNLTPKEWRNQTQLTKAERLGVDLDAEARAERRAELAHDFAFVGDREAAYEALSGEFDR
jgi:hypothetical protein